MIPDRFPRITRLPLILWCLGLLHGCDKNEFRLVWATFLSMAFHALLLANIWVFSSQPTGRGHPPLYVKLLPDAHLDSESVALPASSHENREGRLPSPIGTEASYVKDVMATSEAPENGPLGNPSVERKSGKVKVSPPVSRERQGAAEDRIGPMVFGPVPHGTQGIVGLLSLVELEFDTFIGGDRRRIGRARHVFRSRDGVYGVSIQPLPDSPSELPGWRIEVSGQVSQSGLSPVIIEATGLESSGLLSLDSGPVSGKPVMAARTSMRDGLLDRQSALYQFMANPPSPNGGRLWMSDGVRHVEYRYQLEDFEAVEMRDGVEVKALKIRLTSQENRDVMELWVLPETHYLPVKVRYSDRNGQVTEQLVRSIRFE